MRITRVLMIVLAIAMMGSLLFGADLKGKWSGKSDEGYSFVFNLQSQGTAVTGTMLGAEGKEYAIKNGKLDGKNISFGVESEWQGQPVELSITGTVSDDQMQLDIGTADGSWSTAVTVKRSAS